MADGILRLQFDCQEMNPEKMAALLNMHRHVGYLSFKGEAFVKQEIDFLKSLKVDAIEGIKTPSQKLRAVLYLVYNNEPEGFTSFETYYAHQMERIINHYKSKLP
jgi:hypothetical protein